LDELPFRRKEKKKERNTPSILKLRENSRVTSVGELLHTDEKKERRVCFVQEKGKKRRFFITSLKRREGTVE